MQFDDRLATVLRNRPGGERAARTQFRQLLDLIGSARIGTQGDVADYAFDRLAALSQEIPASQRATLVREPGLRMRNPRLVLWLAEQETDVVASTMATARLTETDWLDIIPRLPVPARGLLRHRRDLPPAVNDLLARLGVSDLVLPSQLAEAQSGPENTPVFELHAGMEAGLVIQESAATIEQPASVKAEEEHNEEISALVSRIEAFQRARKTRAANPLAPRLPLGDRSDEASVKKAESFDFATNASGCIDWADPSVQAMVAGLELGSPFNQGAICCDSETLRLLQKRLPVIGGSVELAGAPAIAGHWRIDATPRFSRVDGHFEGYCGRMRRRAAPVSIADVERQANAQSADRIRQMLHELRTPVNAIQGFAEVIQQQVFGPAPNEYRALAAAIGVDIARIQAGFDELERLAKLESGVWGNSEGTCDLAAVLNENIKRLGSVLRPRSADLLLASNLDHAPIAMAEVDAQQMCWRILASLVGAIAPGELLDLQMEQEGTQLVLRIDLPASLDETADIFAATRHEGAKAVTAGMFGTGFSLRLARAEARNIGGDLVRQKERLILNLPLDLSHDADGNASGASTDLGPNIRNQKSG